MFEFTNSETTMEGLKMHGSQYFLGALVVCLAAQLIATAMAEEQKVIPRAIPAVEGQCVFICGHSFHTFISGSLEKLAKAAGIEHHVTSGVQFLGNSSVKQHWELPDDKNKAKQALNTGNVDVLTLSPKWIMPDPAIDKFVDLALEKNPKVRVLVQLSWMASESDTNDDVIKSNDERDQKTVEQLNKAGEKWTALLEAQVRSTNERIGKQVVFITPVRQAVTALRAKIIAGEVRGIAKQSELFADVVGHGTEPIQLLTAYCNFATIYKTSPVGLRAFDKSGNDAWNKLNLLLQQLAWGAVREYPFSGVAKE